MSSAKENTCRKFQANIFNKSKCQNCFKPRELHLLTDQDLNQAKPIYGGWLCLAPEGTDFDNPMQRSRKWQRRFFVLYEHGCLRFALDESPSTLPQGTVNMNLCTDVIDAEARTGQKNALCIITPEQEYYIRGDNKEIINGWSEQLVVYPRTNKQNQKKKRKVEPATSQEPGPAKVAVTGSGIPEAEKTPDSSSIIWQEELQSREAEVSQTWSSSEMQPLGSPLPSAGSSLLSNGSHISGSMSSLDSDASGKQRIERQIKPETAESTLHSDVSVKISFCFCVLSGRSNVIEKLEALELEHAERMEVEERCSGVRQGRSEMRRFQRELIMHEDLCDHTQYDTHNSTASVYIYNCFPFGLQPDLLNFKKGWMVKLDEQGQWKKYWFVLTDHSLRYYKDSIAEEASDLDGEIDLSTCYNVTEYQAQRNYGFQIHTQEAVHTLSAMTAGIRRNWIQAVMKNVRPSTAPDVASLTDEHASCGPFESLARPDITQDSPSSEASAEREGGLKKSRARERRREGRSKTFDWAEFRPIAQALAQQRAHEADTFQAELTERNKRREERRRRYESVTGSSFDPPADATKMDFESVGVVQVDAPPPSVERQQRVEDEIEQHWQQVEKTPIREERRVPLPSTHHNRDASELEKLVESYKKGVRASKSNLELEGQLKNALEREQQIRAGYISPATCERGFATMEESHQKVIDELQKKHQRELEKLQEEKERLLAEETAATIAAIEAMKNAHRTELERELEKTRKANSNNENADIEEIRKQHEEELVSYQREIEVLSEQYSQKCLENAHLAQALEAERQALRQCQRENQELNAHNQELNNRLAAEITKMRSMTSEDGGDAGGVIQGKELYELEVMLRVKESEVQYLKQEINSLKDELQTAQRDKKYATDKYKDIYTELSIVRAKAERDLRRLREQLQQAHDALGEPALEDAERSGYDIMKSKSNPDILKMAAAAAKRSERTMRSKVGFLTHVHDLERVKLQKPRDFSISFLINAK
uniref:Myosin phosphatase Rho interacting protein n=1 Tax=Cyprinus carpio TaxID=7962 RepID=A0A8C1S252_CYPCA